MIRASSILFWFVLSIAASVVLYNTSYRVQELSAELRTINGQIEAEQANIHVLKAEWVYLSNPTRIETAARKYLAMHPTALNQIAKLDNLPEILPTHKEAMAGVTVASKPIASVGTTLNTNAPLTARQTPEPERLRKVAMPKVEPPQDTAHVNTHITIQPASVPAPVHTPGTAYAPAPGASHILLADFESAETVGSSP